MIVRPRRFAPVPSALALALACAPAWTLAIGSAPAGAAEVPASRPVPGTPTAQTMPPPPPAMPAPPVSMLDGNFLSQSSIANQAALARAEVAKARAGTDPVRRFAAELVRSRTQLAQQLQLLTLQTGLQVPLSPSQSADQADLDLMRQSGPAFDRAFLQQETAMLDRHATMYRQEAQASDNPALRAYANQTLPMLRSQANRARALLADPNRDPDATPR